MVHFDEIVTDPRLRRSRLEEHLVGPRAGEQLDGYLVLSTAGSTGHRGTNPAAKFAIIQSQHRKKV